MVSVITKPLADLLGTGKQIVHYSVQVTCIDALDKTQTQICSILDFTLYMDASERCYYSCGILVATQWPT